MKHFLSLRRAAIPGFLLLASCSLLKKGTNSKTKAGESSVSMQGAKSVTTSALYKGFFEVQEHFNRNIFIRVDSLKLGSYLGLQDLDPAEGAVTDLLGAYTGNVNFMKFENGQPNSLNIVLWNLILSGFANDVSEICGGNPKNFPANEIRPEISDKINDLCKGNTSKETLVFIWQKFIGFEAPEEEFLAWEDFVNKEVSAGTSNKKLVFFSLLNLFFNPYFLFRV